MRLLTILASLVSVVYGQSETPTPTQSGIRVYNSAIDFSSTNGANGWLYGFNDSVSQEFGSTDFAVNSWYLSSRCSAYITKSVITTSGFCNLPLCPTIKSWIEWRNPLRESWDMRVLLMASNPAFCANGVSLSLLLNDDLIEFWQNYHNTPLTVSVS